MVPRNARPRASRPSVAPRAVAVLLAASGLLPACATAAPGPAAPAAAPAATPPEAASGLRSVVAVTARRRMVVTANPLATRAADEVLDAGGDALDAAIAAQLVLGLVEPQSSGLGGGAFLLSYDPATGALDTWDGRETAPAAMRADAFRAPDGAPLPFEQAVLNGASVGVPGLVRMLAAAHAAPTAHHRLPWARLFAPALRWATQGFPVSPRLHALLAQDPLLPRQPATRAYFYGPDGAPWPVGHLLRNPAYAHTLRAIAQGGPDALYTGPIAADIVAAVRAHPKPGALSLADLAAYRPRHRLPVCLDLPVGRPAGRGAPRGYRVCGMGPPTSGGVGVLQILGLLSRFDLRGEAPLSPRFVHLFTAASRLAYADRERYLGDPDFVDVPVDRLLAPAYLQRRAALIDPTRDTGEAAPGRYPAGDGPLPPAGKALDLPSTSHLSIVDDAGRAVSMTTTIESGFGSHIFVRGFLLNNQLTDFSWYSPTPNPAHANAIRPGKRPRSTMSPILAFDRAPGRLVLALGSPGGSRIIEYVARVAALHLLAGVSLQEAISAPNVSNRNGDTELEPRAGAEHTRLRALAETLRAMGHTVTFRPMTSGLHGISLRWDAAAQATLVGAVDPRREGLALGR